MLMSSFDQYTLKCVYVYLSCLHHIPSCNAIDAMVKPQKKLSWQLQISYKQHKGQIISDIFCAPKTVLPQDPMGLCALAQKH